MDSKIFYFEGPDHSGKTTLIESIKTDNDMHYHNGVYPSPKEAYEAFMDQYFDASLFLTSTFGDNNVLIDRGPISEVIYGSVLRGENMSNGHFFNCMDRLREIRATLVLCLPPLEICKAGWKSRLDEELVQDEMKYEEIYGRYLEVKRMAGEFNLPIVIYDYTQTGEYLVHTDSK